MQKAGSDSSKATGPLWVNAEITYKCPLHCVFCYNPVDYATFGPELTTEEWIKTFREARDLGAVQLGLSGGEPLMHHKFLIEALDECGREGYHRTVDTSGFTSKAILLEVAKRTDHWLFDLKCMDSDTHLEWTGVRNEKILENLETLAKTGASINVRIPLIEGVNADDANITESARFIAALEGEPKQVNILPYHKIAENKYIKLGRQIDLEGMSEPSPSRQEEIVKLFRSHGLDAVLGG